MPTQHGERDVRPEQQSKTGTFSEVALGTEACSSACFLVLSAYAGGVVTVGSRLISPSFGVSGAWRTRYLLG